MNIGEPRRTIEVVPTTVPVPETLPLPEIGPEAVPHEPAPDPISVPAEAPKDRRP